MTHRFAVVDQHGSGFGRYASRAEAETHAEGLHGCSPSQTFEVFERSEQEELECEECKALQGDLCSKCYADEIGRLKRENYYLRADLRDRSTPIPMRLVCPRCCALHIDDGEFATKPHHTHSCQTCGETWRPAVVHTVGVRFLPGFKNEGGE